MSTGTQFASPLVPVRLPDAGGQDYNSGDVRHVSPVSLLDSSAISAATRQLAYRDNMLAESINALVGAVNNREVATPIAPPRISLAAGESMVVSNFRVPNGFQARLIDASISASVPRSVQLDVEYNEFVFGESSGTESLVSTTDEFSGGTSLRGYGEFVLRITNLTATRVAASVSALFSTRPASTGGATLLPGILGRPGDKGESGPKGDKGDPGIPGLQGSAGMRWRGVYSGSSSYVKDDLVSISTFTDYGTVIYIALQASTGSTPISPEFGGTSADWQVFIVGARGDTGAQGPQGLYYAGIYDPATTYVAGAVVSTVGTLNLTWVSKTTQLDAAPPGGGWDQIYGPFYGPGFEERQAVGVVDSNYTTAPDENYRDPFSGILFTERTTYGGSSAFTSSSRLYAQVRWNLSGEARVRLPQRASGLAENWTLANATVSAIGQATSYGTLGGCPVMRADGDSTTSIIVKMFQPGNVEVNIAGEKFGNLSGVGSTTPPSGSPGTTPSASGTIRAWATFKPQTLAWLGSNGSTANTQIDCVIDSGSGINSIHRNATGSFTINLAQAAPTTSYAVLGSAGAVDLDGSSANVGLTMRTPLSAKTTTSFNVLYTQSNFTKRNPITASIAIVY